MIDEFDRLANEIIEGYEIEFEEALTLTEIDDDEVPALANAAGKIRRRLLGNRPDLCSIISARSGRCSEDCHFCSQSSRYNCDIKIHQMLSAADILNAAVEAGADGTRRFCIVTSGDILTDSDFKTVLEALRLIKGNTSLKRCASLGRLDRARSIALVEAGLSRYHHNLETARGFYPSICSTHDYDDRLKTIEFLRATGTEICCGGILNLGESDRQRIEFAFELKSVKPDSVPINFLNPRPGTPLAARPPLDALEAVKFIAVFRMIMPETIIRLAAGRCETLGQYQALGIEAGANGLLIGDYLTTKGPKVSKDLKTLAEIGFDVGQN